MTPAMCRVPHDPERDTFGDCVRACVASIMDVDAEAVPHFFHDNCDGVEGWRRVAEWLRPLGFAMFTSFIEGGGLDDALGLLGILAPDNHYIISGVNKDGNTHVVVGKGGKIVHDPSWFPCPLVGPTPDGLWIVKVICRA